MKNRTFIALILFIFPFFLLFFPADGKSQWIESYSSIPPITGSAWFEFDFSSADTGYLAVNQYWSVSVGFNYQILKTTDGGVSWNSGDFPVQSTDSPMGAYVIDISVPDADTFFYTTRDYFNFLYRWTRQGGFSGYKLLGAFPRDLSAVNGQEAYVLTKGYSPDDMAVYYFNGDSVHKVFESSAYMADQYSKIFFITRQVGFIVVKDLSQAVVLLKSLDGGNTFTPVTLPSGMTVNSLFFVSENSGFIAGGGGKIYHTTDQGTTWQQLNTGTSASFNSINFADPITGIAGGSGGTAIITADGGQTWQSEPGVGNLTTARIFSPTNAYICNNSFFPTFFKGIYPVSAPSGEYPSLSIYPNPVEDQLVVDIPGQGATLPGFVLSGITGISVMSGTLGVSHVIGMSQLPAGVYFLKVFLPGSTIIRKIIKK
ncbi:MAG: T9SS type A sorting domain-containing protein [Bacteroidota bacterium]